MPNNINTVMLHLELIDGDGERVDKALALSHDQYSRSQIKNWFKEKRISLNGKAVKPSDKLALGTVLDIEIDEILPQELVAEDVPLDIRYEDEYLLVLNKPQGMVVHPGAGNRSGTLVSALMHRYGSGLSDEGGIERPGIVHRIDKDTSGLLMVVKNNVIHRQMAESMKKHEVVRIYQALVHGHLQDQAGTIIAAIGRDKHNRQKQAVRADGREAITHFELIEQLRALSWVQLRLETGRTHQIRVHMNYIGHPVVADHMYAGKRDSYGLAGQALHASELHFTHPVTGEAIVVKAELPDYFEDLIKNLRR